MKGPFILFIFSFIHTHIQNYELGLLSRCKEVFFFTRLYTGTVVAAGCPDCLSVIPVSRPCLCSVHQGWPSGFSTFCLSSPNNIDLNNVSHPKLRHATKNFHFYFWLQQLGALLGSLLSLLGSLVDRIPIPRNVEDVFY